MPEIDTRNIIKVNIHSISTEQTGGSDNCCTTDPVPREKIQNMKQIWLRNAIHTQRVFQILTIKISQQLITNYLIQ